MRQIIGLTNDINDDYGLFAAILWVGFLLLILVVIMYGLYRVVKRFDGGDLRGFSDYDLLDNDEFMKIKKPNQNN